MVPHGDRHPGVAGGRHRLPRLRDGQVAGQRQHRPARHEDMAHQALVQVEGATDDLALLGVQAGVARDEVAQLLGRDVLGGRLGPAAEQPHDQVGRRAQHRDHRSGQRGQDIQWSRDGQGPRQGQLHREPLGRELTDHQREERQHQGHRGDDHRLGGRTEEPHPRHERFGQRHRGGRGSEETRQRDADLDRGEEAVGVARESDQSLAAGAAGAFELAQLTFPEGDQGHLAPGEGGVEEHECSDEGNVEPIARHGWVDHRSFGWGMSRVNVPATR